MKRVEDTGVRTLQERGFPAFAAWSVVGLGVAVAAGTLFALALILVSVQWSPLREADMAVVDAFNAVVSGQAWLVTALQGLTALGGTGTMVLVSSVMVVWLVVRRVTRLAVYVAVTGLGAGILVTVTKALVDRARPIVAEPLAVYPEKSFPSGHSLSSTVVYGVLLLVFLPVVPPRYRRAAVSAAVALVVIIGLTRVALAAHYPSDVLGGWALGVLWLSVTATAFRRWHDREGLGRPRLVDGLEPEDRSQLEPAPDHDSSVPEGWRSVAVLLVGGVLVCGGLFIVGSLITEVLRVPLRPVELAVVEWFVSIRTPELSAIVAAGSWLGSTKGVLIALVVAVALAVAFTRRWAPGLFLVVAATGETALYLGVSNIVARDRPPVEDLSSGLPAGASFPSGHVAAAAVVYGGIALLVRAWKGGRLGHLALSIAVIVPVVVALARLYRGVHYPTDVVASILYASAWLAICWAALEPGRGSSSASGGPGGSADSQVPTGERS